MPYLFACLFVEMSHDQTGTHLRILHDHVFYEQDDLRLQKAPLVDFKLMVVHHLKIFHPLIHPRTIVPLKAHIHRAETLPRHPLSMVVKIARAEPWLVPQVTTQRKEHQLPTPILLLINRKHQPINIPQLTIRINSVEHRSKSLRKMPKIETKPSVPRSPLLVHGQRHHVQFIIVEVHSLLIALVTQRLLIWLLI